MSVPAPRKRKPAAVDEIVRVGVIFDALSDDLIGHARREWDATGGQFWAPEIVAALLIIADHIAARTED